MPRTHWLLIALTVTGSAAFLNTPTLADSPSLQTQIQTAYDKRDAALNHFDIEGFMSSYTDDYKNVSGMGKPGTSEVQRLGVIRDFQHVQDMKIHETVQSVTPYPDGVTVTAVAVTTRMVKTSNGQTKAKTDTEQYRAFWVHTKMGWRIKQERALSS